MALTIKNNYFHDTTKDRALSVHAKQNKTGPVGGNSAWEMQKAK